MKFIVSVKYAFDVDQTPRFYGPIEAASFSDAQRALDASSLEVGEDEECEIFQLDQFPL
jgi:hypothetical protein